MPRGQPAIARAAGAVSWGCRAAHGYGAGWGRRASRPTALGWHRTACWCACWGILVQSFFSGPEAALLARCPGLFLFARPLYTHSVNACADSSFPSVPLICWFCDHFHFSLLDSRSSTARSKQGTSVGWGGDS